MHYAHYDNYVVSRQIICWGLESVYSHYENIFGMIIKAVNV